MSLLSSSIGRVRCLADEEADHNMLQDLQLAAELGKTLLERNKELENCIKLHQCTIDDQAQEIEYMKKQTAALKEVNDSRLKIYEQLEVSIQDLERANQRLALENSRDKNEIKSQCLTIDTLEARLDDQQKKYDDLQKKYDALREEQSKSPVRTNPRDGSTQKRAVSPKRSSPDLEIQQLATAMANDEDVTRLLQQLQEARSQRAREQKRVAELKEQLDSLLQDHAQMEEQLGIWKAKAQDMKDLQAEINALEEVRQGQLCGRCLRGTAAPNELSMMLDTEEDDDLSLAESLADSLRDAEASLHQEFNTTKPELSDDNNCNQYRDLVEKYEALLKVQQNPAIRRKPSIPASNPPCMSLQEELQMSGEFSNLNTELHPSRASSSNKKKPFSATPTDFSEAETSSSGFSDETSTKATQTEGRPGAFLCSIADGDDCKISIYDDSSTFESRFLQTPEYRKLFSEIFEVLKRAAEAKDEGAELPLLDDASNGLLTPKAENCSSVFEDAPSEMTDDTRSIVSLAVSSVVSEPVFRVHTPILARKDEARHAKNSPSDQRNADNVLRPINNNTRRHQPLEYISLQVRKKTKKSARKLNSSSEQHACTTPDIIPTPNPRVTQLKGSGRRKFRPLTPADLSDGVSWNGNTVNVYPSRSRAKQLTTKEANHSTGQAAKSNSYEYKPGTVSEEVAKLRRLEMSYAEALRMPNKSKAGRQRKNH